MDVKHIHTLIVTKIEYNQIKIESILIQQQLMKNKIPNTKTICYLYHHQIGDTGTTTNKIILQSFPWLYQYHDLS